MEVGNDRRDGYMDSRERDSSVVGTSSSPSGDDGNSRLAEAGSEAATAAKRKARSVFEDAKRTAVDAADDTSAAIEDVANALHSSGRTTLSQAAAAMADRLHGFSDYLENRPIDELFEDARRLAQRNPGLFIAGGVVLGLALSRFLKASIQPADRRGLSDRGRDIGAEYGGDEYGSEQTGGRASTH
jgi:hypothetical protein